ncbi:MAG: hypothetical protein K2H61_03515, partial [Muribaculaceae bacterium]|nr:hypothetical protein [Muribaculaceae bacterium]
CRYLNTHAKGGDTGNFYFIANEMTDSVLIFGSSRAIHHYNPKILEDSLQTTVYNCGLDGNGIIFNYGRLLTVVDHYTPSMIIYDVMPKFDMIADDNSRYLQAQRRWYDVDGVAQIFHDVNPLESLKMRSNLYRYNETFIQMLSDNVKPMQNISYHGFKPIEESMNYDSPAKHIEWTGWDPLKLKYFQAFADLCRDRGIELVISYSPFYKSQTDPALIAFTEFAKANNLRVFDYSTFEEIAEDPSCFSDASHLNHIGADRFTNHFASTLLKSR